MTCSFSTQIESHFALSISSEDERRLRAHLPTCGECTRHYERRQLLQSITPRSASTEARLGAALGLAPARRAGFGAAWALLPVAAAVLLMVWLRAPAADDGFAPRGADAGTLAWLEVYRLEAGKAPMPNATQLSSGGALAFAYRNPESHPDLMLFAVDSQQRVRWYFPEWVEAGFDLEVIP